MRKNRHVIIFARAPHYGRVKRRLAKDIGNICAYRFYRQNLENLITELRVGPWNLHIAVASAQDARHPMFAGMPVLVQPYGDLGHRMLSVLQLFSTGPAIIVGSDIHQISRSHLETAFSSLVNHDVVFGPAFDGGFWLVGCGRIRRLGWRFMRGVRWSSRFTLEDSKATVPSGCRVGQVAYLHDIDDGESYRRLFE